eukprot:7726370-Pyramimonas_sp.AAC.1
MRRRGGPVHVRAHLGARDSPSEADEVPGIARGAARGPRPAVRPLAQARPRHGRPERDGADGPLHFG